METIIKSTEGEIPCLEFGLKTNRKKGIKQNLQGVKTEKGHQCNIIYAKFKFWFLYLDIGSI